MLVEVYAGAKVLEVCTVATKWGRSEGAIFSIFGFSM